MDYEDLGTFFKALSHPVRLMIVAELLRGEKCVNDMKELLKVRQPNISQHLGLLRLTGIVGCCKMGKVRCYFLNNPRLIKRIIELIARNKESGNKCVRGSNYGRWK